MAAEYVANCSEPNELAGCYHDLHLHNVRQKNMQFPDDENGAVLRRMYLGGDTLTTSRTVDFCFAFPAREKAIAFASAVPEKEYEACISFYEERDMWQVIVKKFMLPNHPDITSIKLTCPSEPRKLAVSLMAGVA